MESNSNNNSSGSDSEQHCEIRWQYGMNPHKQKQTPLEFLDIAWLNKIQECAQSIHNTANLALNGHLQATSPTSTDTVHAKAKIIRRMVARRMKAVKDNVNLYDVKSTQRKRRTYKHSMQPPAFITPGTITPPIKLSASYLPPSGTSLKLPTTSTNTSMALKSPLPAPTSPSSSSCQQYTQTAHVVEGIPVTCDAMKFSYQLCTTPSTISLPQRALTSRDHLPSLSGLHFIAPAFSGNLDTKHTTLQPQVYPNTLFNFAPPTTYVLSSPYQQALALRE